MAVEGSGFITTLAYYDLNTAKQRLERTNEKLEMQLTKCKNELERNKKILESET